MAEISGEFTERTIHEGSVTLELSYEEAKYLKMVVGRVSGDPSTVRRYTDTVYDALDAVVQYPLNEPDTYFKDGIYARRVEED